MQPIFLVYPVTNCLAYGKLYDDRRDFFVLYLKHRESVNYPFLPPFFCSFNLGLLLVGLVLLAFKATQPFFIWFPLEVAEETLRHKSSVAEAERKKKESVVHCIFSFKNESFFSFFGGGGTKFAES